MNIARRSSQNLQPLILTQNPPQDIEDTVLQSIDHISAISRSEGQERHE